MSVRIREEELDYLSEYARIPIAFEVDRVLELSLLDAGPGGASGAGGLKGLGGLM